MKLCKVQKPLDLVLTMFRIFIRDHKNWIFYKVTRESQVFKMYFQYYIDTKYIVFINHKIKSTLSIWSSQHVKLVYTILLTFRHHVHI